MTFPQRPGYYQYSREIRVDLEGRGDFTSIAEACDAAALYTRDSSNFVLIRVNDGRYYEPAFTVPAWTILQGLSQTGETVFPGVTVIRDSMPSSDTTFITMSNNSVISKLTIAIDNLPALFDTQYAIVYMNGADTRIDHSRITALENYDGANPLYGIYSDGPTINYTTLSRSHFYMTGTGVTMVSHSVASFTRYCTFDGNIGGYVFDFTTDSNHQISFCRIVDASTEPATNFINATLNSIIDIVGTRIPLDKRSGTMLLSDYQELHPTPQQLKTAITANSRTISGNDTIDAYTDGTIEVDGAFTVFMPPIADATLGQTFVIKAINAAVPVTVDGNGVNIDGAATQPIVAQWQSLNVQKNDRNTWSLV